MIKKGIAIITALAIMMTPATALAKNHVTVTGSTVKVTMDNGKTVSGKYIPSYRYIKWTKAYLRMTPNTGKNVKLTVKQGTKVGLIWTNGKWSAVMYNKECYFIESAGLAVTPPLKAVYTGAYFRRAGGINWQGKHYTWYSMRVMPGLRVPGKWVDSQGFVRDGDGYFVCGSNVANKNKRVIVATPFGGYAKCYDCGYVNGNHFDMYVNW